MYFELEVWWERNTLRWTWGSASPNVPDVMTQRNVFLLCKKLVVHLSVCGWLLVATAFIERQVKSLHIKTDSLCVYRWLSDTLAGKARVRTKVASEMMERRRLSTMKELVQEYKMSLDVVLVASSRDVADKMTSVPQSWLDMAKKGSESVQVYVASLDTGSPS